MRFFKATRLIALSLVAVFLTNVCAAQYIGFTGVKHGTKNVLFSPWLGTQEAEKILSSAVSEKTLDHLPQIGSKVGQGIWVYSLGSKSAQSNKLTYIRIVKGAYGFDGGDVALEVYLQIDLTSSGKHILMVGPLPKQNWKITDIDINKFTARALRDLGAQGYGAQSISSKQGEFVLLTLNELPEEYWRESSPPVHILFAQSGESWAKVYEDKKWSLEPSADFNGDGFPEFYAPYTDSADGNLISIYSSGVPIDVSFSSGH